MQIELWEVFLSQYLLYWCFDISEGLFYFTILLRMFIIKYYYNWFVESTQNDFLNAQNYTNYEIYHLILQLFSKSFLLWVLSLVMKWQGPSWPKLPPSSLVPWSRMYRTFPASPLYTLVAWSVWFVFKFLGCLTRWTVKFK